MIYYLRSNLDGLVGFKYNNDVYYYIKNIQDDIIGILDSSYNIVARYEYDSWGNIISIKDGNDIDVSSDNIHIANINPFRYRSYYYDKEVKLYYLNNRYYNPLWGRFINADNYVSTDTGVLGYNMYAYCNNNIINYSDITGHGFFVVLAVAVVVIGAVVNTVYRTNKAKKEIAKVQAKTNVQDKTKELNATMEKNATRLVNATQNQTPVEKVTTFVQYTKTGSTNDLKSQPSWQETISYKGIILESQDIGNLNFGYVGRAVGYDVDFLTAGGGGAQLASNYKNPVTYLNCFTDSFCDDPRDTYYIRLGAIIYDATH